MRQTFKLELKHLLKAGFLVVLLSLCYSCSLFENDVADFMEKYTETAAVENHTISVDNYFDASNQLCIASDEDCEITFFMRNPKQFSLIPSVNFTNLETEFSRSAVTIEQPEIFTVQLSLPQKFLIPVDEGKDITTEINLQEPMSGRNFDKYIVNLHCNTKPPVILNPTVLNNSNQTFVLAFDMPNEEEVAIRHKDLAEVVINGQSFPVSVTTVPNPDADSENPDSKIAVYEFSDSHFSRSWSNSYNFLNSKDFVHNKNSVYFETGEAFSAVDKEYTIELKDKAGLSSTVKASTSISKLKKPVLKDQTGTVISENGIAGIPFDEETMKGTVTIIPPVEDHLGNPVSGTTVYYRVYEATGSGLIYTSGTTTSAKTIELPQNTYRIEAYATLTNYENSSTTTVKFRFINNILYVKAAATNGDGSEGAPYGSIAEALDDINSRPRHDAMFTIYAEDDGITKLNEDIDLHDDINTDQLTIAKKPGAASATIKSVYIDTSLPSSFSLIINGMTIDGADYNGIQKDSGIPLTISDVTITNSGSSGLEINAGSVTTTNLNISSCPGNGIKLNAGSLTYTGGTISGNGSGIGAAGGTLNVYGGTISLNNQGIAVSSGGQYTISGGNITQNSVGVNINNSTTVTFAGGSITGNTANGVTLAGTAAINVKGNPFVQNNGPETARKNVVLPGTSNINITGLLTEGCKVGVFYEDTTRLPTSIGSSNVFTTNYGSYNTETPSHFFTSDQGKSIVPSGSGSSMQAAIGLAGASGTTAYSADDFKFTFAIADEAGNTGTDFYAGFFPGVAKNFVIIPTVKRKESNNSLTLLSYNATDKKLREGSNIQANGATVSWTVSLYNGGTLVKTYTASELTHLTVGTDGAIKIPVSHSLEGNYTLKATATYLGIEHSAEFNLLCSQNANDVVGYINSLTGGTHTIALSGPITADNIAAINTAIKNKYNEGTPRVYVDLDLSDVTGLTSLADNAFKGNSGLHSIVLPEGITSLGEHCFDQCYQLQSINLPDSITSIGAYCFASHVKIDKIPAGLTSISAWSFSSCGIEEAIIPDSVTSIGLYAFMSCTSLTRVVLPSGITELPEGVFYNTKITSIELPEGLETIGHQALGATKLTSVHLPSTLTFINDKAFTTSRQLASVTVAEGNTTYKSIDGVLYKYNAGSSLSLKWYPVAKPTTFVIPADQNITSIEGFAFYEFTKHPVTSVTIPVSVTTIKDNAFICCDDLATLNYAGTTAQWAAIEKETYWKSTTWQVTVIHCSDGDVTP